MTARTSFIVYVSCSASREIHSFRMNPESGAMTLIEIMPVPGEGEASRGNMPLAVARDGRMLHAISAAPRTRCRRSRSIRSRAD